MPDLNFSTPKQLYEHIIYSIIPTSESPFIEVLLDAFSAFDVVDNTFQFGNNDDLIMFSLLNDFRIKFENSLIRHPEFREDRYREMFLQATKGVLVYQYNDEKISNEEKHNMSEKLKVFFEKFLYMSQIDEVFGKKDIDFLDKMRLRFAPGNDSEQNELYYWPYPPEKLNLLYQFLLSDKMVSETSTFSQPFATFQENPFQKNEWLKSQPSLFVLLYLIYKNEIYYEGELISIIAIKLFRFKNLKSTAKSTKENFRKTIPRLKDKKYLEIKHKSILEILNKLSL